MFICECIVFGRFVLKDFVCREGGEERLIVLRGIVCNISLFLFIFFLAVSRRGGFSLEGWDFV